MQWLNCAKVAVTGNDDISWYWVNGKDVYMTEKGMSAAFLNLGCKVNAYETDAMIRLFQEAGYEIKDFKEQADIYVINTCTVTNIADRKSRQMLHRAKKQNPNSVVAAVGCYVQADADAVRMDPAVDVLIGNNQKNKIVEIIETFLGNRENEKTCQWPVGDINRETEYETLSIDGTMGNTRAYIKIQDGCSQFCTYCIIPYARGRVRSRPPGEIAEEVRRLVKGGYKEIVLTGIHLSSYGTDLAPWSMEPPRGFETLSGRPLLSVLEEIHEMEGLERIRLGSLEPRIINAEFVEKLSEYSKLCPHFHLSLQSGCDETLKRMNRKYTTTQYLESCRLLRSHFDNPAVTTDVITGFPGETDEEFCLTKEFVAKAAFADMHVFKYSRRKGTKAADMEGQVPEEIKNSRSEELGKMKFYLELEYRKLFMGRIERILIEDEIVKDGRHWQTGHNERYVKMAIPVSREDQDLSNRIVEARVKGEMGQGILFCEHL